MRNKLSSIALLSCVLLLCQCKKKDKEADPQPQKESWQRISDSVIDLGAQSIQSSYSDNQHLMFFAYNRSYILDSTFAEPGSYQYSFNCPKYINNTLSYKAGPHFRIFNDQENMGIMITVNQNANSSSLSYLSPMIATGVEGKINDFTAPDEQDNFYAGITTGTMTGKGVKSFLLYKYHLVDEGSITVRKELLWNVTLSQGIKSPESEILNVNAVDNIAFVTTLDYTYRIEDGRITDSMIFALKNVVKYKQYYIATCSWRATADQEYPDGLLSSADQGRSWQYIGTGSSFPLGQLLAMDNNIFLNTGTQLSLIDLKENKVTPLIQRGDINGYIRTLNLFRNKVYVGTEAGVYYKSREGFMHP